VHAVGRDELPADGTDEALADGVREEDVHRELAAIYRDGCLLQPLDGEVLVGPAVVEDEEDLREMFRILLESMGCRHIYLAEDGAARLVLAILEPTLGHMTIQDPALPTDARFLHVLQGADPGVAPWTAQARSRESMRMSRFSRRY